MRKAISIFLIFVTLFGSWGFTISTHFCGGKAADIAYSFSRQNVDCGMEKRNKDCEDAGDKHASIEKSSCCSDEYNRYIIEDDYSPTEITETPSLKFLVAFTYAFMSLVQSESDSYKVNTYYSPPLLIKDIAVVHQTFLI